MRLNSILQGLFRDTPLDHIWRAQICAKNAYLAVFGEYLRKDKQAWVIWSQRLKGLKDKVKKLQQKVLAKRDC